MGLDQEREVGVRGDEVKVKPHEEFEAYVAECKKIVEQSVLACEQEKAYRKRLLREALVAYRVVLKEKLRQGEGRRL